MGWMIALVVGSIAGWLASLVITGTPLRAYFGTSLWAAWGLVLATQGQGLRSTSAVVWKNFHQRA